MKSRVTIKLFALLTAFLVVAIQAKPQSDSILTVQLDSVLKSQQGQAKKLLTKADSAHKADSLTQALLLQQIANIKAEDEHKKAVLQVRLDSMKGAQQERRDHIKLQVDSLRANTSGVPVVIFGDTIFHIYAKLGPFTPSDRASSVALKVNMLVEEHLFDPKALLIVESAESHDVMHNEMILFSITDRDAFWVGKERNVVAMEYSRAIENSVLSYKSRTSLLSTLKRIGLLILVIALFILGISYLNRGFSWLNKWLLIRIKRFISGVKFKEYEFLSQQMEERLVYWALKILKWLSIALVVYLALPILFSIFPATKGFATTLFGYIFNPLKRFGAELIGFIPELITIIVIVLITLYFVRFLKFLSNEVESEKLQLPGFYPDWARPTFDLLRIIIYAFAFIIIFPYLPGSDSPVFQGVSVFLGLLISLGSSSAIGNIIAGLVITYMRAFKIGDRVRIGDTTGDVISKSMLVTRLRTIKNEDVTIPNSAILNGSTINYSSSAQSIGLILHSTVTIGYDVPWRKVHELLIGAATKIELINKEPHPFVLQTSLDDFYVSYQINAYTHESTKAAKIYSELHANIQDAFNEAGVEILSPHYRAARDGNTITLPPDYLPPNYQAPAFNVKTNSDGRT